MEKIKCICVMRELFKALSALEASLEGTYGLSLNEAMVVCSIGNETVAASVIVERTGMRASHTSKVIRAVEDKGYLFRTLGKKDKRQMYFSLTAKAKECLADIKEKGVDVPELLVPLFKDYAAAGDCENLNENE